MATNGNGYKAIGGILALFAIVSGVFAIVEPMNQKIDFIREEARAHGQLEGHTRLLEDQARAAERFKEVETQFRDLTRRVEVFEVWMTWWQRTVPVLDATQDGRLNMLEELVRKDKD